MAADSKAKKRERRSRRANTQQQLRVLQNNMLLRDRVGELSRQLQHVNNLYQQAAITLLAVLTDSGPFVLQRARFEEVQKSLANLDYEFTPVEGTDEVRVSFVARDFGQTVDAELTPVEDETTPAPAVAE